MYVLLKNIAIDLTTLTEINAVIFPYQKFVNDPILILEPRGTTLFLRGAGRSPENLIDAEHDFSFIVRLQAAGKGEELVQEFYRLNEICDKAFSKRIGVMNESGKSQASLELKKRVNQGIYGEIIGEGELENAPFVFEEIWDATLKFRTFV